MSSKWFLWARKYVYRRKPHGRTLYIDLVYCEYTWSYLRNGRWKVFKCSAIVTSITRTVPANSTTWNKQNKLNHHRIRSLVRWSTCWRADFKVTWICAYVLNRIDKESLADVNRWWVYSLPYQFRCLWIWMMMLGSSVSWWAKVVCSRFCCCDKECCSRFAWNWWKYFCWCGQHNIVVSWYLHNQKSILFIQISHGQSRYHSGRHHVPKRARTQARLCARAIFF